MVSINLSLFSTPAIHKRHMRKSTRMLSAKKERIVKEMNLLHPEMNGNPDFLLNISFRCGDDAHCQWEDDEEVYVLTELVKTGKKPVGGLCHRDKNDSDELKIKIETENEGVVSCF